MALDFGLKDVHVLITGAAGGVGIELTRTFLQLGAKVSAHYNSSPRELSSMDSQKCVPIQAEVTNEEDVRTLFDKAEAAHGVAVQILLVNHGIFPLEPAAVADMALAQWRKTLAVNLDGPFLLCREFLRRLRGQSSEVLDPVSICFTGSTAGKFGEADHGDYASSKAALMYGLTTTLKNEIVKIAPKGRVNSVNPGWIATPMAGDLLSDTKAVAKALASTPLQKVAVPSDVARQIAIISSPSLSGHVTGVNIMVDGGMEGRLLFPPSN